MKLFKKVLIANRGEIAVRIMRTAKRLNIKSIAIFADDDKDSLHLSMADEAYSLGNGSLQDTYLNVDKIIAIAKQANCDALHPGYGFLAENAQFVDAVEAAGMIFIGPSAKDMQLMGDKIQARKMAIQAGVPTTKGIVGLPEDIVQQADTIDFPVLVKASAGGGGKGMRIVHQKEELYEALQATSREALNYFGDGTVYIEKFLENPRHIEIQVLGDKHGNAVYLFERECSIQRRYQKILEEAPSPTLRPQMRKQMGEAAIALVKKIGYSNAGTIEFLVDKNMNFYFLEMNTRIQVEHPVTEMISGKDLVEEQFYVAAGNPLRFGQQDLKINGHAIECRIYAEDPENNFMPSPGQLTLYAEPKGENIRVDTGINSTVEIKSQYDPMISKLIVWAEERDAATRRMSYALRNYRIHGIKTNLSYLIKLIENKNFISNNISTGFCDNYTDEIIESIKDEKKQNAAFLPLIAFFLFSIHQKKTINKSVWEEIGYWRQVMQPKFEVEGQMLNFDLQIHTKNNYLFLFENNKFEVELKLIDNNKIDFRVDNQFYTACASENSKGNGMLSFRGLSYEINRKDRLFDNTILSESVVFAGGKANDKITSPMPGKVIKISVKEGDVVKKGQTLLIVEAMKMENNIVAPQAGIVEHIFTEVGKSVDGQNELVKIITL